MSDELAKEIAEALTPPVEDLPAWCGREWNLRHREEATKNRNADVRILTERLAPILRPHIERHERLRKVAFDAGVSMLRASDHLCDATATDEEKTLRNLAKHSLLENLAALRAALDEETKG